MDKDAKLSLLAEDILDLLCLESFVANLLYPKITHGRDREKKLREAGGEFWEDVQAAVKTKITKLKAAREKVRNQ